jgi:hypothetical protein
VSKQRGFWGIVALILVALVGSVGAGIEVSRPAAAQTAVEAGYRDYSFEGTGAPTAEKPQSKLWFNDGSWWGVLWDPVSDDYHIYRFDWQSNSWSDTGTLVDPRHNAKADALWDGTYLYVASAPNSTSTSDQNAYLRRYSYDASTKKYSLNSGFPVKVASGVIEAIVLDKDTTGKLWVTYTQGSKVYVNNSGGSDTSWSTPFVLPVSGTSVTADDISSVIAFDGKIGVMWSNQIDDAIYFAIHKDGDPNTTWQESRTAIQGPNSADDHLNIKSVQADASGKIYAAVKTAMDETGSPSAPLVLLLERDRDGNWNNYVFGRAKEDHTRPMVILDEEHRDIYMFATAPISPGGVIYYKKTSMDNILFEEGLGTPFIQSSTDTRINNPTSTKQNVTGASGILMLAADDSTDYYLHNTISLGGGDRTPPETTIVSGPSGTVTSAAASFTFSSSEESSTFECSLDGAAFATCVSPQEYADLSDGTHTFRVRATDAAGNTDPSPASRSWAVDTTAPTVGSVSPQDGATGVALWANVEATFSEAMDPATLTTGTFTLARQDLLGLLSTPVSATVTYDAASKKATLNPDANLQVGATYTAIVKGGSSGAKDAAGNPLAADKIWSFTTTTSADTTAPTVQPPAERFPADTSTGGTSVPVEIKWSATDSESAIVEYQLQQSSNGGGTFSNVSLSSATSTSKVIQLTPGKTYQYRVRARDAAGNLSDWAHGPRFVISAIQETNSAVAYAGTWTQAAVSSANGGGVKYATGAGDTATFTFTGREVAWLAARGPDRGRAEVWLDGAKVANVDLYRKSGTQWRRMVFATGFLDPSATHTLEVRVSGTAGRPRVDVDAFFTIK